MKKIGLVILGIGVLLIGIISFSKEEKKVLVEEEINNSNTSLVFMLQDKEGNYNKSEELPSSGYSFNTSKSVCSNNTTPTWEDNKLYLNNLNKNGTSCYLYFDRMGAKDTILLGKEIKIRILPFTTSTTVTDTTTGTIYKAEDDDGDTYYFAGNPQDNWVKFAGFYWRIIRINGDGSLRIIYNGTSPITTGANTQIGTSAFNTAYHSNEYVGYMYTGMEVHGISNSSAVKLKLDEWYKLNIVDQRYMDYIDLNAGFCNDRTPSSGNGLSISSTKYALYDRLTNVGKPTFKCSHQDDLFTVATSNKGNKALQYPIGLITGDEVWYAGGGAYNYTNNSYYLYTSSSYWTMSPSSFGSSYAYVFYVNHLGDFSAAIVDGTFGVGIRPVINLKSNVHISDGNGLADSPFLIS